MKWKRIMALVLTAAMLAGLTVGVSAAELQETAEPAGTEILRAGDSAHKDETVYVMMDADGAVDKILVSDWIQNTAGEQELDDISSLHDIENVKGSETYTIGQGSALTWQANGSDIYYKGTSESRLPVDVAVSYALDGKPVSAAELEGKDGRVTIRFDYENREKRAVEIDGEDCTVSVPFLMLTGMVLDSDRFRNVDTTSGTVLSDASHLAVLGVALPGMTESLGVDTGELEIPEAVEITADVTDFSLMTTITLAIPISLESLELDEVESFDDLQNQLKELTDGVAALVDGSDQLYDGIATLLEKSGELIEGVDALASGAQTLRDGAANLSYNMTKLNGSAVELAAGAGTLNDAAAQLTTGAADLAEGAGTVADGIQSVSEGAGQVSGGLQQISGQSSTLNNGAKEIFDTLLAAANVQLTAAGLSDVPDLTVENYAAVLSGVAEQLDPDTVRQMAYSQALQQVTAAVNASEPAIRVAVEEQRSGIYMSVLSQTPGMAEAFAAAGLELTYENYLGLAASGAVTEEQAAAIDQAVSAQIDSLVAQQKQQLIVDQMASDSVQNNIEQAVAQATAGQNSISALKSQLDSYAVFYQGVLAYTAGVDQAAAGTSQLAGGAAELAAGSRSLVTGANMLSAKMSELAAGTGTVSGGMQTMSAAIGQLDNGAVQILGGISALQTGVAALKNGSGALVDGVQQIEEGAGSLRDGIKKLDEEGIQKIKELFEGDLEALVTRMRAIADVAGDYNNYSGLSQNMTGNVKLIYKTDSIGE